MVERGFFRTKGTLRQTIVVVTKYHDYRICNNGINPLKLYYRGNTYVELRPRSCIDVTSRSVKIQAYNAATQIPGTFERID